MKYYDLIEGNGGIRVFNFGVLEKKFDLSLSTDMTINVTKVRTRNGEVIALRYVTYPGTHKFEQFISRNYEPF